MEHNERHLNNNSRQLGRIWRVVSTVAGISLMGLVVFRTAQVVRQNRKLAPRLLRSTIGRMSLPNMKSVRRGLRGINYRNVAMKSLPINLPLSVFGGYLLFQGISGRSPVMEAIGIAPNVLQERTGIDVISSISVLKPRSEVYSFWMNFGNFPRFMEHVRSVDILEGNGRRSHWVVKAPVRQTVEWDAEMTEEIPNQVISWRSLPGSMVDNRGTVRFNDSMDGEGTVVTVHLTYEPPAGALGSAVAKMLGEEPSIQLRDDLARFKQVVESA